MLVYFCVCLKEVSGIDNSIIDVELDCLDCFKFKFLFETCRKILMQ